MWTAIAWVTGPFSLAAFLAAVVAYAYRQRSLREAELIHAAPEDERARLVQDALEFFHVETSKLTRQQQYEIAMAQIQARARRFAIVAGVITAIAILSTALACYAISRPATSRQVNVHVLHKGEPVDTDFLVAVTVEALDLRETKGYGGTASLTLPQYIDDLKSVSLRINGYRLAPQKRYPIDRRGNVWLSVTRIVDFPPPDRYPDDTAFPTPDEETLAEIRHRQDQMPPEEGVLFQYRNKTKKDMWLFLYDWDESINGPTIPPPVGIVFRFSRWVGCFDSPADGRFHFYGGLADKCKGAGYIGICVVPKENIGDIRHQHYFGCHNMFRGKSIDMTVVETSDPQRPYAAEFENNAPEVAGVHRD